MIETVLVNVNVQNGKDQLLFDLENAENITIFDFTFGVNITEHKFTIFFNKKKTYSLDNLNEWLCMFWFFCFPLVEREPNIFTKTVSNYCDFFISGV